MTIAVASLIAGYAICFVVLGCVLTLLKPGSDAAAGVLLLGEAAAGGLGLLATVLAIMAGMRSGTGFSAANVVALLGGLALLALAPIVCLGYIVASTPFV